MAKKLDPKIGDILKSHGFGPEAAWDCHGTWVVYHSVLEQIAAKAGIVFDPPQVLEADGPAKCVALCVSGALKDRKEWSIGEAAPGNNKNSYPYAMAEKRGKDRVILKLIGLHGLAYSEEEADSFAAPAPQASQHPAAAIYAPPHAQVPGTPTTTTTPQSWAQIGIDRVNGFTTLQELDTFEKKFTAKIVQIAPLVPDLHAKLVAAMADKRFVLEASA